MFFSLKRLFKPADTIIWVEAILIKQTQKAILIEFDGRKAWFPKAWILKARRSQDARTISIKIAERQWAMKF